MAKLMFNEDGRPITARSKSAGAQHSAGKGKQLMQGSNKSTFGRQQQNDNKSGSLRVTGREADRNIQLRPQKPGSKRRTEDDQDQDHLKRALKRMEMGPDDDMSDLSDLSADMDDDDDDDELNQDVPGVGTGYAVGAESEEQEETDEGEEEEAEQDDDDADEDGQAKQSDEELGLDGDDSDVDHDHLPAEIHNQSHNHSLKQKQSQLQKPDAIQQQGSDDDSGSESDRHHDEDDDGGHNEDVDDEEQQAAEAALAQLAELPLEQRLQLLQDGTGPRGKVAQVAAKEARLQEQNFKRANRHRPQEMSSKKPVSRFREIVPPARKAAKDPRFGTHISDIEKEKAAKRYAFLYDDVLTKEKSDLRTALKSAKQPGARNALSAQLQRVEQALSKEKQRRVRSDLEHKLKSQQRSAVEAGKKPFFLKASDKKKLELVAKYQELKSKGQLDRYVEKRRKHNASKDHRYVPHGRRGDAEDM